MTEGLLPRANRSAEGCYRRRWKGEEIEEATRSEEGGEEGQDGREGAVSGTGGRRVDRRREERGGNDMPG